MIKRFFYIFSATLFIMLSSTTGVSAEVMEKKMEALERNLNSPPDGINYQAVLRNADGTPMASADVTMKFTITDEAGTALWVEEHSLTTDIYGGLVAVIGEGTKTSGSAATFDAIDWGASDASVKVEVNSGDGFVTIGTSAFKSVPYAAFAANGLTAAERTKLTEAEANVQANWDETDVASDAFILNKPTIPTDINELADADGLLNSSSFDGSFTSLTDVPENLDTDATDDFSGSFADLTDVPENLDTDATDDFSGDYADLLNKPTIPSDVSDLTDEESLLVTDISDLTDESGLIPTSIDDLADEAGNVELSGSFTADSLIISGAFGLPTIDGDSGQVLTTDGAGRLSWQSPSGGYAGEGEHSFVAGTENGAATKYSFVGGGKNNTIGDQDGSYSGHEVIGGGVGNYIDSYSKNSVIVGGYSNYINESEASIVAAGVENYIKQSMNGTISGGYENSIRTSYYATIAGGSGNAIWYDNYYAAIGGGVSNEIRNSSKAATIAGGYSGYMRGSKYGTIGGGYRGRVYNAAGATVAGGYSNQVENSEYGTVSGGKENEVRFESTYGTVAGGYSNSVNASKNGVVSGGAYNGVQTNSDNSVISGGYENGISGSESSVISGGAGNSVRSSDIATIGGGYYNQIGSGSVSANGATIAGGKYNVIGYTNSSTNAFIGGGYKNKVEAYAAATVGGQGLETSSFGATAIGFYNSTTGGTPSSVVSTDALFIAGNGVDDSNRSDAFVLYKNGNADFSGSLVAGSLGVDGEFTLPTSDGSNGQVLATDGSGSIGWATIPSVPTSIDDLADGSGNASLGGTFTADSLVVSGAFGLPAADGTEGQILQTNGSGIVSWATIESGASYAGAGTGSFNAGSGTSAATGDYAVVAGGLDNTIESARATISGGKNNAINGTGLFEQESTVAGGSYNTVNKSNASFIGAGTSNYIGSSSLTQKSVVVGGNLNQIKNSFGFIGGGNQNKVHQFGGAYGTIVGGSGNVIGKSSFASGYDAQLSFIGGGKNHKLEASFSSVLGGRGLATTSFNAVLLGSYNSTVSGTSSSWVATDPLLVVGNGTASGAKSDAMVLLKNGNATLNGEWTAAAFNVSSDRRLKENITDLDNVLETLVKIEGYKYNFNNIRTMDDETEHFGVIAQELQKVYPQLVKEGEDGYLSVDYTGLIPLLLEAVKELNAQNQALMAENDALEKNNNDLEARQSKDEARFVELESQMNMLMMLMMPTEAVGKN